MNTGRSGIIEQWGDFGLAELPDCVKNLNHMEHRGSQGNPTIDLG